MKLSQFRYYLPPELIPQFPPAKRDECRLMVLDRKKQKIEHRVFKNILQYINDGDVMIVNNTKTFPARLYANKEKTGAKIEVFLLRELDKESRLWDVLVDPARKIRIGNKLYFGKKEELVAEIIDNTTSRGRIIRFLFDSDYDKFKKILYSLGETPIPKIHFTRKIEPADKERYSTLFGKHEGSIAVPSAHMHFTRELIKRLEIKGVNFAEITLHVGLCNFRQIEVEDLSKFKPDSEQVEIPEATADLVNNAKLSKKEIFCIGTTTVKTTESAVTTQGFLKPFSGWTNKFIFPPYDFKIATRMVTNFHLPQSIHFIMVAAFAGYEFLMEAYKVAVKEKYKFFTFGDAMLIL